MTVTVTDLTGDSAPKVEVRLTGVDAGVATVTGYRLANGREQQVSGIIRSPFAGAGSWVDFEAPAEPATYRFELFGASGEPMGFTEAASIELGYDGCWMHNPFAPNGAVRVELSDSAGQSLSRPVPGSVVRPRGRRVGVVISGPRSGLQGVVLNVFTENLATADRVQALIDAGPVVCVRFGVTHAGMRIASPLFLGVFDIAEEGLNVRWGGSATMQRIQGDEVARPAPGVFVPLLRRKDLNAYYATRAALNAAYLTRLDAIDYSLAGFAGD